MDATLGRVIARLEQPPEAVAEELIDLINTNINPPTPVTSKDVHVRALYVISDEINSYGGCFPVDEHQQLADLLIDSPVLVGHRKDRLPIGRNFHATVVERDGRSWVKSYFYWLASAGGADDLRDNIDGGIYKECSIAFTYCFPECSVCGRDIRTCPHEPVTGRRRETAADGCYFNYRQIERVLETSLVYRGAIPNTAVSRDLIEEDDGTAADERQERDKSEATEFVIRFDPLTDRAYVVLDQEDAPTVLVVHQFHCRRFLRGARFVADECESTSELLDRLSRLGATIKGAILRNQSETPLGLVLQPQGTPSCEICFEATRIEDNHRFLMYCRNGRR